MTIEEAEEKLSNMHFDDIVKSYCNKVNDLEKLKNKIKNCKCKNFRKCKECDSEISCEKDFCSKECKTLYYR